MADNDIKQLLHPLLIAPSDPNTPSPLTAEFRKRNKIYNFKSVSRQNLEKYYDEGWEYDRKLKKKTRIKQIKGLPLGTPLIKQSSANPRWAFFVC